MKFQIDNCYEVLIFNFYKTALHIAVQKENLDIVQLLLNHHGININEIDEIKTMC